MSNIKAIIPKETDLNNVVKSGFYRLNASSDYTNFPNSDLSYGQMLVIAGGYDTVVQMAFSYSNSGHFYLRAGVSTLLGGSIEKWQNWKEYKSV